MWDDKLPLASQHFSGEAGRVDVSPLLGSLLKALPLRSDARTMNLYTFTLSLLHLSWSDEQQALFLDNAYGVAGASVSEMSAWFGVDRVAQRGNAPPDPPEDPSRFSAAGWAVTSEGRLYLAASPRTHTLAAFRERGIVLHIGETKNEAYRNTYRLASAGALPFADGWLVQGPACVDDISPAELARFDVVILEDQCMRDVLAGAAGGSSSRRAGNSRRSRRARARPISFPLRTCAGRRRAERSHSGTRVSTCAVSTSPVSATSAMRAEHGT